MNTKMQQKITLHFINIKELKFLYRQNINKLASALVASLRRDVADTGL